MFYITYITYKGLSYHKAKTNKKQAINNLEIPSLTKSSKLVNFK